MRILLLAATLAFTFTQAIAGGLTEEDPLWMEPPVDVPYDAPTPFSWSMIYGGISGGQSTHTRTTSGVDRYEEIRHSYACVRGSDNHLGRKCKRGGFNDAPELADLDTVNSPWRNAKDQDVLYVAGYDGLWMGASERFEFTLDEYRPDIVTDAGKWAHVEYERLIDVTEVAWSETTTEGDTTLGGFIGVRHQFDAIPFVVGLELNAFDTEDHGSFTQFGAQAGFAVGRVLPYAEVGAEHVAVGTDVALFSAFGGDVLTGVRHWEMDNDDGTQLRVGYSRSF